MIGEPYSIEADIRGKPTDEQQHMRQRKASRRREASEARIRGKLATLSHKSELPGAIQCSLNHRNALTLFCEPGEPRSATRWPRTLCAA